MPMLACLKAVLTKVLIPRSGMQILYEYREKNPHGFLLKRAKELPKMNYFENFPLNLGFFAVMNKPSCTLVFVFLCFLFE